MRGRRLVAQRLGGPFADQHAGLEVVGGEGGVGGIDRIERRIERDHQDAGIARLLDRRHDRLGVARRDQDALGAGGDQALDRGDLPVIVAVELAGEALELDAEFLGLGVGAFLHLDEERVGVGLGDQADEDVVGPGRRRRGEAQRQEAGDRHCQQSARACHSSSSRLVIAGPSSFEPTTGRAGPQESVRLRRFLRRDSIESAGQVNN